MSYADISGPLGLPWAPCNVIGRGILSSWRVSHSNVTFRDDDLLDRGSDPLISVIGPLSDLEEGERVVTRLRLLSLGPEWSRGHQEKANPRPRIDPSRTPHHTDARIHRTDGVTMAILGLLALPRS